MCPGGLAGLYMHSKASFQAPAFPQEFTTVLKAIQLGPRLRLEVQQYLKCFYQPYRRASILPRIFGPMSAANWPQYASKHCHSCLDTSLQIQSQRWQLRANKVLPKLSHERMKVFSVTRSGSTSEDCMPQVLPTAHCKHSSGFDGT